MPGSLDASHAPGALPVCALPCSARFAIWCLRVAALSIQGCELASRRLCEVHEVLRLPEAIDPLERCVRLLASGHASTPDLGEFGTLYPTGTEVRILEALERLQRSDIEGARLSLSHCVSDAALPQLIRCLDSWSGELRAMGAVLS